MINPYRIGRGPGYTNDRLTCRTAWHLWKLCYCWGWKKKRRRRGGRRVKRQRELWKGRRALIRVGTLNIETMSGRGRELADMMDRRNVDILCLQETKWKENKARNIGVGCKLFYNGAGGRRNGIGKVMREELVESVLKVKKVSDRLMAMQLEVN